MNYKRLLYICILPACLALATRAWAQQSAPTDVQAAPGNLGAAVSFQAPTPDNGSAITGYTVVSNPSGGVDSNAGSTSQLHVITGLNNGTPYTFTVTASNSLSETSSPSDASNSVTPSTTPCSKFAGPWNLGALFSGIGSPLEQNCTMTINADGTTASDCTFDGANSQHSTGNLWLFPDGARPTLDGDYPLSDWLCEANQAGTVIACTATYEDTNTTGAYLSISTKKGASYSQAADLPGKWLYQALDIFDSSAEWSKANVTISGSGQLSGTNQSSDSSKNGKISGVLSLSSTDGNLICESDSCGSGSLGYMDAGKTLVAGAAPHYSDDGSALTHARLQVILKKATSYSLSDVAGLWQVNQIDSNGTWRRGTVTVQSDGSAQENDYGNAKDPQSESGTLRISSAGVVTYASQGNPDQTFYMDASKTIMATTLTKSHSGGADTYRMLVFTKAVSPPSAPTGVSATPGNASATVGFTAPTIPTGGSPIAYYTVTSNPGAISQTGTSTSITIGGLQNGKPYTFTVTATNEAGLTGPPSAKSKSVKPVGPTLPHAPTGVTAKAGNAQATVSFKLPSGGGPFDCTVTSNPGNIITTGSGSPITVTGLTNGTVYQFRVTAKNSVGTSPPSGPSNKVTPATLPDAPTITDVTTGKAQATVTFTAPNANGSPITGYTVTASSDATAPKLVKASGKKTQVTVKGLINGQTYTFTVTAKNKIGTGPASAPVQATPGT
jgi:hypothetical protein